MKGRNKSFRVRIDGRTADGKERLLLVKRFLPNHLIKVHNTNYISHEAAAMPIADLRDLKDEARAIYAKEGKEVVLSKLLKDFDKTKYRLVSEAERLRKLTLKALSDYETDHN